MRPAPFTLEKGYNPSPKPHERGASRRVPVERVERRRKARSEETKPWRKNGTAQHEGAAGIRCPLWAPDPALEPQDEEIHLRGSQRHLHSRPSPDDQALRGSAGLRQESRRRRRI